MTDGLDAYVADMVAASCYGPVPEAWPPAGVEPYYVDDAVCIVHGDCREVLPKLEGKVDIVITDPPYNAGKNYGKNTNDRRPWNEWAEWLDDTWDLCLEKSEQGVLSFLSQTAYRAYVRHGRHEMAWTAAWVKPLSMAICAAPFMPHWEPIAYWGPARRKRGDGFGWGSDVLTFNVEYGKYRWGHPTPKPLMLLRDLVSRVDGLILDPFMGSGTTLRAAKDLGRRAIGIEIEERYCKLAAKRMAQAALPLHPPAQARQRTLPEGSEEEE